MKRFYTLAIIFLVLVTFGILDSQVARSGDATRVQIVYHSDTRGYYRPCG